MVSHLNFWKGPGKVLTSLTQLRDLRFGFAPLEDGTTNTGTWFDTDDPDQFYTPL
jgi:hypothetical protein